MRDSAKRRRDDQAPEPVRTGGDFVPQELMRPLRAFMESRLILTALEIDVFSAVGAGATAVEVAARGHSHPGATERLLDALVGLGLLIKRRGRFENAPLASRYLCAGAPADARAALRHQVSLWRSWSTLTEVVRTGHALPAAASSAQDDSWTVPFIAAMHSVAAERAPLVVEAVGAANVQRLLDVGGGSGAYSIAFAQANPALRAEILDLATVVPIAEGHIRSAGLGDRIQVRAGDLRSDPLGQGFDLVLLSSICHMLSPEANRDLLARAFRALIPGGRVVISDFILDPDRTTPRHAALFSINMLVGTSEGNTYTEAEYGRWLEGAGFADIRRRCLPSPADLMLGRKP